MVVKLRPGRQVLCVQDIITFRKRSPPTRLVTLIENNVVNHAELLADTGDSIEVAYLSDS